MSYKVEIIEDTSSSLIEIQTSINDQEPSLDVFQSNTINLSVSHDIALLPSDLNSIIDNRLEVFLISDSWLSTLVSGLVPIKNINGSGYININSSSGNFIISVTGLQPSGNYALLSGASFTGSISSPTGILTSLRTNNIDNSGSINMLSTSSGNISIGSGVNLIPLGQQAKLLVNSSDFPQAIKGIANNNTSGIFSIGVNGTSVSSGIDSVNIGLYSYASQGAKNNYGLYIHKGNSIFNNKIAIRDQTSEIFDLDYIPQASVDISGSLIAKSGHFYDSLKLNNINVSVSGHIHTISNISGLQNSLDSKQPSGNYSSLIHNHQISDITNFNSGVSDLLPVKNIVGGSYVNVISTTGLYTIGVSGLQPSGNYESSISSGTTFQYLRGDKTWQTLNTSAVTEGSNLYYTDNRSQAAISGAASTITTNNLSIKKVLISNSSGKIATSNIADTELSYLSGVSDFLQTQLNNKQPSGNYAASIHVHTVSDITGLQTALDSKQPSGSYATTIHAHAISDITNLQSVLDNKQPSGNYASLSHNHTASNITDFNSSVSGLLSIKNINGSGYISVVSNTGNFTIVATGLQPSGNYSLVDHSHNISNISGLQTALDDKQPSGSYANLSHTHLIVDISGLQSVLDSKQASGNYAPLSHTHTASNITDFNNAVSGLVNGIYAPLSSPTLTGIPLAPTASSGTNTNQIASTSFVRTEISNLISSAPSTLDTLNELATALGNDPNFATTITNNLAGKAALSGAIFTGSISSPSGSFTQSLKVNGVDVSVAGHNHIIGDVTGLQTALDSKQPSGNYAANSHTHTSSQITDFNTSVSGLLPIKNISAGYDISVSNVSGNYTIASTNLVHVDSQQPQGFINRTDSVISVSGNVFTIAPTGSSYSFYSKGLKVTKTASESVTIPNITQMNYIHFDVNTNSLQSKTTMFDFSSDIPVAFIAWNSGVGPSGQMSFFAEERHGIVMDMSTHRWIHNTFGAQYISGLSISNYSTSGNGSSNSHATIAIGDGLLYQEDIEINITDSSSTEPFHQELSPIAQIPVYYHSGSTGQWVKNTATNYPVKYGANGPQYNLLSGGTWTTPDVSPGGATRYFAVWILATNQIDDPIISIMGQRIDSNAGSAENNNNWADVNLTNLPLNEVKPLYRLIFAGDSDFTNTPKCYLYSILDLRAAVINSVVGIPQNDHGTLFGLADDDHAQYVHIDNPRTISANHTFSNGLISNGLISSTSGNFGSLSVNNIDVSISGHTHSSSNITNFNSSVSGLLPVKDIIAGSGINITSSSGTYTINSSSSSSSLINTVTGTGIGASTSGYLSRWINTSGINNSIIYQNGNNVGIGTTSPQSILHLADNNSTTWLTVENTNTGAGTTVGVVLKDIYASTPNSGLIYNDWSGDGLIFKTSRDLANSQGGFVFKGSDNTTRMVIRTNSNGNVGIGTDSPSYKLDVMGSVRATGDAIVFNKIYGPVTTGNAPSIQIGYGSSSRIDLSASTIFLNGSITQQDNFTIGRTGDATSTATQKDSYSLLFQNSVWNGSSAGFRNGATIKSTASTTINNQTRLSFLINNGDDVGNSTERLCITNSGNVGIGTTAPSTLLDINNNKFRLRNSKTPTSPSDIGDAGDVCWDANYIYVCVSSNTWKRTAITGQWSTDTYFSYVSLLLHMNGSGSTFIDDGPFSKQVVAFGGATQSSAQSRFGSSSLQNSASRYLSVNGGSEFNFGTGDFCVELWAYPTEAPSGNAVISNSYTDDNIVGFAIGFSIADTLGESTGSCLFFGWYNNGWVGISTSSTLNLNAWNHIAVSRTSNTTRLYLNGTQLGSVSTPQLPDMTTLFIGRRWDTSASSSYFVGYIDEVRITKGYNRNYTGSTITVPTSAFPDYNS